MKKGNVLAGQKGFTLLELILVVGIMGVMAATAVMVINPVEYFKQSRDVRRVGDIKTINAGIESAIANSPNIGQGNAQTVYISIADTAANCPTMTAQLPALPTGWSYNCSTAANLKKTNGTGWLPINFDALPAKSPLTTLPTDPRNDASTGLYYAYIPGGSYSLSAALESEKYLAESAAKDTGLDPTRFEQGSDHLLLASATGLIGYWPLDEGTGTATGDMSGRGHNGTFAAGAPTWTTGKMGGAINFNGSSAVRMDSVATGVDFSKGHTMAAWFNPSALVGGTNIFMSFGLPYLSTHASGNRAFHSTSIAGVQKSINGSTILSTGNWYFIVGTYDNTGVRVYVNGELNNTLAITGADSVSANLCIGAHGCSSYWSSGKLDEIRAYNRPLSQAEIRAMYNAGK